MIIESISRILFFHLMGIAAILYVNLSSAVADDADPTTPSAQITERMMVHENRLPSPSVATVSSAPSLPRPSLRLKAIVLRDPDHGTAIVSCNATETCVVMLQRNKLQSTTNAFHVGGMTLTVKDFSESSVIMQSLDQKQQFLIN
jgi:hypothetical protein